MMQRVDLLVESADVARIKDLAAQIFGADGLGLSQSCNVVLKAAVDGSLVYKKPQRKTRASEPEQETEADS